MGAFDTYNAVVRCPSCAAVHWIDSQTKFFDPDYETQVWFRPGISCPIRIDPRDLDTTLWEGEWLRVREPASLDRLDLLADFDDLIACECGFAFAIVLRFAFDAGTATFTGVTILDARRPDLASHIDFISTEPYLPLLDREARATLAAAPVASRAAHLARCIAGRFDRDDEPGPLAPWTHVVGPTRCEACGDVRERTDFTQLTRPDAPSFFGPAWAGGALFLGTRITFDDRWLEDDVDRGLNLRARHPVGRDRILMLNQRNRYGCSCGVGPGTFVLHFARRPGELELVELTMRVIDGAEDLADIDFIAGSNRDRGHTRDFAIGYVLADHLNRWRG
jgi:hypothetical protein